MPGLKSTTSLAALAVVLSSSAVSALPAASVRGRGFFDLFNFLLPESLTSNLDLYGAPDNDWSCQSDRNPVVVLHGLGLNRDVPMNKFQKHLISEGWCAYSVTYGSHSLVPWMGGLTPMRDSTKEVAEFIRKVHEKTGKKVDLVGHSEGGVMSIYTPMTQPGIADIVERAVALGPAVHGARYYGVADLWYFGGDATRNVAAAVLNTLGCNACDDMATDGKVFNDFKANAGRIAQPGVKTTVLMSRADTLVAPEVSSIDEPGVRNIFVQDYCADDKVGHLGLAWDHNIWAVVKNELLEKYDAKVEQCDYEHIITV